MPAEAADDAHYDTATVTDAAAVRPAIETRLSRLIQLDTVSATVVEQGTGEFEALLAELYPLTHRCLRKEKVGERGLLFTWRGASEGFQTHPAARFDASEAESGPVVLMAHFDTVPADAADWSFQPFSGAIEDGVVHGRGAIDDKGALTTIFDAVENLLAQGFTPARTVYLSLGGDEETTGPSARAISDELQARGIRPWLVLDEGGAVVDGMLPMVRHPTAAIGVAEKGAVTVRMTATAAAGHAGTPARAPAAIHRLARAITRLRRNPFPKRLSPITRQMFTAYSGVATGAAKALVVIAPRLGPVTARLLAAMGGEPAAAVQTTVAVTIIEGGTAYNVVPHTASATLNLRLAVGDSVDEVVTTLERAIADPAVRLELLEGYPASPESRTDSAQWQAIADAVGEAYPGTIMVPYVMLAASDARHFQRYTAEATYRFAPLAMSADERAALHGIDERVTVDALERGERFYRQLLLQLPT